VCTFRLTIDGNNNWKIFDAFEKWLIDLQTDFNKAIKNFETDLHSPKENIGQPIKVAS
jgi:hypothetical protein